MFQIDFQSRTPVFEQIVTQAEEYLLAGVLKSGDKLPSVRELTAEIGVNPNTIQKAYTELERKGLIVPVAGRGSYISKDVADVLKSFAMSRLPEYQKITRELAAAGIPHDEIRKTVEEALNSNL